MSSKQLNNHIPTAFFEKNEAVIKTFQSKYSLDFLSCLFLILHLEGGLKSDGGINDKSSDKGGLTKFGISQRAYPSLDIATLKIETAVMLYHRDYWRPLQLIKLPKCLQLMLFDAAVQHGVTGATVLIQNIVPTKVDGLFGSRTLSAIKSLEMSSVLAKFTVARGRKYARICANDISQKPNLEGWFNRLAVVTENAIGSLTNGE